MHRVLVTGGTGFIGQHLVRRLAEIGVKVTVLVRPTSDLSVLADVEKKIDIHEFDQSYESVHQCFERNSFGAIFHLATHFAAEHSADQLQDMVDSNISFGIMVANAATDHGIKNFINVSTNWQYYHSTSYRPLNLYASLKQAFENILAYYSDAKGLKVANVILFDTYGDKDTRKKLIPLLLSNQLGDKPIKLSPGAQLMDLTHVDQIVEGLIEAKKRLEKGTDKSKTYIASSGKAKKLREVVLEFCKKNQLSPNLQWGDAEYRDREIFEIQIYDQFENLIQ